MQIAVLTGPGQVELRDEPAPPNRRNELLLKLFFAARDSGSRPAELIENFRSAQLAELERYAETRTDLEAAKDPPPDMKNWLITLRYGELETEAHVKWADEALSELAAESGA